MSAAPWVGGERLHVDDRQLSLGDDLSLEVRVRPESEDADLARVEHRATSGECGEPVDGVLDVEHVRHAHRVQRSVERAGGDVEVAVPIEVDQPDSLGTVPKAGHGPHIAPEDEDGVFAIGCWMHHSFLTAESKSQDRRDRAVSRSPASVGAVVPFLWLLLRCWCC